MANVPAEVKPPGSAAKKAAKAEFDAGKKAQEDADFVGWTPWYVLNCIRGPIIAIVVMLALTNVSLATTFGAASGVPAEAQAQEDPTPSETSIPGGELGEPVATAEPSTEKSLSFEVDLSKASEEVLLVIAFILGMYSRVSVATLESIGERVFQGIWKKAFPDTPEKNEGKQSI
jgi:hypothetical protein